MIAVFKHELKTYYNTLMGYVFAGIMLLLFGMYGVALMKGGDVHVEYILANMCLPFCILVTVVSMRVLSEERKLKTDQLLYSLPLSTTEIILGKFLALLTVFAVPLLIFCAYPLIFNFYGNINLLSSYLSILAFFFLGAALLAIGMFISSLFENQFIAGGVCLVVLILNYFLTALAEMISESAGVSLIILMVLDILVVLIIWLLTKNDILTAIIGVLTCGGLLLTYFIFTNRFEGFAVRFLKKFSMFDHYYNFMYETFSMVDIVFLLSVCALFLFLSVQSLEKRRWS